MRLCAFLTIIIFFFSIGCATGNLDISPPATNLERLLKIESITNRVLVNNVVVKQEGFFFEDGLVEAQGNTSEVTVAIFDGDTFTLKNGSATAVFVETDSISGLLDYQTDKNLNLRRMELIEGEINFRLQPRKKLSKVTYRLIAGEREFFFKDADFEIVRTGQLDLIVHRGEVTLLKNGSQTSEVFKAGQGASIRLH